MRSHGRSVRFCIAAVAILVISRAHNASAQTVEEPQHLSIENLTNVEITWVSKRPFGMVPIVAAERSEREG
jgi:hypothetical protein